MTARAFKMEAPRMPEKRTKTDPIGCVLIALIPAFLFWWNEPILFLGPPRGLTFDIAREVEIASSPRILNRSALNLVCSSTGETRLVVQARLPGPRDGGLMLGSSPGITLFIGHRSSRKLELPADLVAVGRTDTLATPALTQDQLDEPTAAFHAKMPGRLTVGVGTEMMVFMRGNGDGRQIRELIAGCQPSSA